MPLRMTKQRLKILNVIKASNQPLTAEQIYRKLDLIDLSTVYRALDRFVTENIITIIPINKVNYYLYTGNPDLHLLICRKCLHTTTLDCHEHVFNDVIDNYGFEAVHHSVIFYGVCKDCQPK